LRSHFGEAGEDHDHAGPGQQHGDRAELSKEAGDGRGKPEYAAADHGVDDQGGQAPAADGAHELVAGWARWEQFRHRAFVSQMACAWADRDGMCAGLRSGLDGREHALSVSGAAVAR